MFGYSYAAFILYKNDVRIRTMQEQNQTPDVQKSLENPKFSDANFFRTAAEELSSEDIKMKIKSYRLALFKSPADYRNFLDYAVFSSSHPCCITKAPQLFRQAVKRKSADYEISVVAGTHLLKLQQKKQALSFFESALLLNPSAFHRVYQTVLKNGGSIEDLISITSRNAESLVNLFVFLSGRKNSSTVEMKGLLDGLERDKIQPEQRITLSSAALDSGQLEWAQEQAMKATSDPGTRMEALQILMKIAEKQSHWEKFGTLAAEIEQSFRKQGLLEKAADFALQAAIKKNPQVTVETKAARIKEVLNRYPDHARSYVVLAELYEDSPNLALPYLQRAAQLAPEQFLINSLLAQKYIAASRFSEAEEIYKRFLRSPKTGIEAYVGISSCRLKAGRPEGAAEILKDGLRIHEQSVVLLRELAKIYEILSKYQVAAHLYEDITEITPKQISIYLLAAEMYEKAGNYSAAGNHYRTVLALHPGNKTARKALSRLSSERKRP
jgi:tetratricopeptide (TPR) repeat protein